MTISLDQLKTIVKMIYPQTELLKTWELTGGISAQITALEIVLSDGTVQRLVLRQHGKKDRTRNPNNAKDEYKLLQLLHRVGLPVPKPYAFHLGDQSYILVEYIDGKTHSSSDLPLPDLHSLVHHLNRIHQILPTEHDLSFLPDQDAILEQTLQTNLPTNNRIHHALKRFYPRLKTNASTLLHGDYWLGNILWREHELVGIIDWEDAMLGDSLSDLGKSRLELTWLGGHPIADTYTQLYAEQMPHINMAHLHFWDLWGALRLADFVSWFDDTAKVKDMQILYDEFVDRAIVKLSKAIED